MENYRTSSEEVLLKHFDDKITNQEELNKKIENVIKLYERDLEGGMRNVKLLKAARKSHRNFLNTPQKSEGI